MSGDDPRLAVIGGGREMLPLLDLAKFAEREPTEQEWALERFIPRRQATYLTGPGSSGKSLLGQQYATCCSLGLPFMGVETCLAPTLYVTCEDGEDELERRQKAICDALSVDRHLIVGKLHLSTLQGELQTGLLNFSAVRMEPSPMFGKLRRTIEQLGVRLLILDNVAHFFTGNENSRVEVAAFVNVLNKLALELDISVLLIGHPNKAGAQFSGSTAWENQFRSRLLLKIEDRDDDPDVRVLSVEKANYTQTGATLRFRWFKGAFVRDEDLPPSLREEIAKTAQATADNERFLRCLDERNAQKRPVSESKMSRTYAPKEFAEMAESNGVGQKRMEAALDRLFRIDEIETGVVCRVGRKDREGLRRKRADLRADPALTLRADLRRPPALTRADTHLSPKGDLRRDLKVPAYPRGEEGGRDEQA